MFCKLLRMEGHQQHILGKCPSKMLTFFVLVLKHNGLHFCCPHYNKALMRRCDSKDGNCTLSICCKFCEGRKHAFH